MPARRFLAAAVQMNASANKGENLRRAGSYIEQAARRGAALVTLPEVFFWRGQPEAETAAAEPIPGPTTERICSLARQFAVYIVAGSILEHNAGQRPFNTSVLIDPRGQILAKYRKIHLFDVAIPGRVEILESARRQAGDQIVIVETELGTIGLTICYDLRFPELFRALTLQGAEIIALPSAFTFFTGAAHWEVLLRARAVENQVYVIAPNQIGKGEGGVPSFGHSAIVDPWGIVVGQASDEECVVIGEVDLEHVTRVRAELPCLSHIRLPIANTVSAQRALSGAAKQTANPRTG